MPKLSVRQEAEVLVEVITSRRPGTTAYALKTLDAMPKKKGLATLAILLELLQDAKGSGDYWPNVLRRALTIRT